MARIVAKGFWVYANDDVTEGLVKGPTKTRAAIRAEVNPLVSEALADPTVTTIVSAAVDTRAGVAVDQAINIRALLQAQTITVTDNDRAGLNFANGDRMPGFRADGAGGPADITLETWQMYGMLRTVGAVSAELRFTDALGQETWLTFSSDGGFLTETKDAIVNRATWFTADPARPFVERGNKVYWLNPADNHLYLGEKK